MLGFPCDQFGHQEPGDEAEIKNFCSLNYDVTFPMFAKIEVNGADAHPLYKFLKYEKRPARQRSDQMELHQVPGRREGSVVKRYAPTDTPEAIGGDIAKFARLTGLTTVRTICRIATIAPEYRVPVRPAMRGGC